MEKLRAEKRVERLQKERIEKIEKRLAEQKRKAEENCASWGVRSKLILRPDSGETE